MERKSSEAAELYVELSARAAEERARGNARLAGALALIRAEEDLPREPTTWTQDQQIRFLARIAKEQTFVRSAGTANDLQAISLEAGHANSALPKRALTWVNYAGGFCAGLIGTFVLVVSILGIFKPGFLLVGFCFAGLSAYSLRRITLRQMVGTVGIAIVVGGLISVWNNFEAANQQQLAEATRMNKAMLAEEQKRTQFEQERAAMLKERLKEGKEHVAVFCHATTKTCTVGFGADKDLARAAARVSCEYCGETFAAVGKCVARVTACFLFSCKDFYEAAPSEGQAKTAAFSSCAVEQGADGARRCEVNWSKCAPG